MLTNQSRSEIGPSLKPPAESWRCCAEIARAHGRTFYFARRFLPPDRRRAMLAAYAFCRIADDIVDRAPVVGLAGTERELDDWERQLARPTHPVAVAFADVRARYGVPAAPVEDLIAGVRMDLSPRRFATWEELRVYCYQVAGTVGLITAPILGCREASALPHAVSLGIAMQLTNILRDVAEDGRLGRLYLPLEDLDAFDCDAGALLNGKPNGRFADLMAFEIDRARWFYEDARHGIPALSLPGRLATLASGELYAKILTRIEEQEYDVFSARAVIPTRRKLRAMPGVVVSTLRAPPYIG